MDVDAPVADYIGSYKPSYTMRPGYNELVRSLKCFDMSGNSIYENSGITIPNITCYDAFVINDRTNPTDNVETLHDSLVLTAIFVSKRRNI